MPGSYKKSDLYYGTPRLIKSELKSRRIIQEQEKPVRWSFMKVLREYSTLKQFYPEINPYTEIYQVRDNTWAMYNDSFDGAGDVWMYLIDGPEKTLLVDDSFGVGDLKGLIRKIIGDKELIVVNTHAHYDHCYGNAQFEKVYCHEYEVPDVQSKNNPDIWDYLFNQTDHDLDIWGETIHPGDPIYTSFDKKDLIVDIDHKENYKPYEIVGIPDEYEFDLGEGYIIEAILLPGHTPGMCGYYDHHNHTLFSGDCTGMMGRPAGTPFGEYATVEGMYDQLIKLKPRLPEMEGVFPGHGMLDQSPVCMEYLLDTVTRIMENPENYDKKQVMNKDGNETVVYSKLIEQWSAVRYKPSRVYKKQFLEDKK